MGYRVSSANAVPVAVGNEQSLFFEPRRMCLLRRMTRGWAEREEQSAIARRTSYARSFSVGRTGQVRPSSLGACPGSPGPSLRPCCRLHTAVGSRQGIGIVCPCTLGVRRHRPGFRSRAPRRPRDRAVRAMAFASGSQPAYRRTIRSVRPNRTSARSMMHDDARRGATNSRDPGWTRDYAREPFDERRLRDRAPRRVCAGGEDRHAGDDLVRLDPGESLRPAVHRGHRRVCRLGRDLGQFPPASPARTVQPSHARCCRNRCWGRRSRPRARSAFSLRTSSACLRCRRRSRGRSPPCSRRRIRRSGISPRAVRPCRCAVR